MDLPEEGELGDDDDPAEQSVAAGIGHLDDAAQLRQMPDSRLSDAARSSPPFVMGPTCGGSCAATASMSRYRPTWSLVAGHGVEHVMNRAGVEYAQDDVGQDEQRDAGEREFGSDPRLAIGDVQREGGDGNEAGDEEQPMALDEPAGAGRPVDKPAARVGVGTEEAAVELQGLAPREFGGQRSDQSLPVGECLVVGGRHEPVGQQIAPAWRVRDAEPMEDRAWPEEVQVAGDRLLRDRRRRRGNRHVLPATLSASELAFVAGPQGARRRAVVPESGRALWRRPGRPGRGPRRA